MPALLIEECDSNDGVALSPQPIAAIQL